MHGRKDRQWKMDMLEDQTESARRREAKKR